MPGKCKFQPLWLEDLILAKWLRPVGTNKYRAFCTFCKRDFDVGHGGINSIRLHQKGQRHSTLENALLKNKQSCLNFVTVSKQNSGSFPEAAQASSSSSVTQVVCSDSPSSATLNASSNSLTSSATTGFQACFLSSDVTKAEILWAMTRVMLHGSDRSFGVASEYFPLMFPDSVIASKFKMHKDKLSYVVTFGLGPYFESLLIKQLKKCEYFCISFDESLNKISQLGQMDLVVRFWDSVENKVHTKYLTSVFLKRTRAVDLLEGFLKTISDFGLSLDNIMQIALDGPNVNLKFLEDFKHLMLQENSPEILDTGTCSLHIINNAYKTAHNKTEWAISSFLPALYFLFKDFPSRRAKFKELSGTNLFPLKLCTIRWTENSKVLARAIAMMPSLKLYVENVKNDPPDSKNFLVLQKFLRDNSLTAKLHFLRSSVVIELEPFLTRFQSNKPMIPFLYGEVYSMSHSIASRFVKKDIMAQVGSGKKKLQSLEYKLSATLLPLQSIDVGFGARAEYKKMSDAEKTSFQKGCKAFFLHLFEKLAVSYKSPLSKSLVKGLSCLSPDVMKNETVHGQRISLALKEFVAKKHLAPIEGDQIKRKYLKICDTSTFQSELKSFNEKTDRLDEFFMQHLDEDKDAQLLKFIKLGLSLFHGNAEVERGFSVNKECLVENLQEQSLIAQRSIYSSVTAAGGIKKIEISKGMISSVMQASKRRRDALACKETEKSQKEKNVKELSEKIKILEEKKRKIQLESESEINALMSELNAAKLKKKKLSDLC